MKTVADRRAHPPLPAEPARVRPCRRRPRDATGIKLAEDCLRRVFGPGFYVRVQRPLGRQLLGAEPDVAVVKGAVRDYLEDHPTTAALVVEVSNETLHLDRTVKQHLVRAVRDPPSTGSSPSPRPALRSTANPVRTATAA